MILPTRRFLSHISTDSSLNPRFQYKSLIDFWYNNKDEFPVVTKKALRALIPLEISYLCKCRFTEVALSKITPRFQEIMKINLPRTIIYQVQ